MPTTQHHVRWPQRRRDLGSVDAEMGEATRRFGPDARTVRSWVIQFLFLLALGAVVAFLVLSSHQKMVDNRMVSGFGFLFRSTGWPIGFSLLPYDVFAPYWRALLAGMLNSLLAASIAIPIATLIGIGVAALRSGGNPVLNAIGALYVETFRNVPIILQLFFWYAVCTHLPRPADAYNIADKIFVSSRGLFMPGLNVEPASLVAAIVMALFGLGFARWISRGRAFSSVPDGLRRLSWLGVLMLCAAASYALVREGRIADTGWLTFPEQRGLGYLGGMKVPPELLAMIIAVSIYGGTYMCEIFRAGFLNVPKGQVEAARALGMSRFAVFVTVQFPLALRMVLPALSNQCIWLLKATSLGIVIGFADYFMVISVSITQSGQTIELILLLMGGYLVVNFLLASIFNLLNRALAIPGKNG